MQGDGDCAVEIGAGEPALKQALGAEIVSCNNTDAAEKGTEEPEPKPSDKKLQESAKTKQKQVNRRFFSAVSSMIPNPDVLNLGEWSGLGFKKALHSNVAVSFREGDIPPSEC